MRSGCKIGCGNSVWKSCRCGWKMMPRPCMFTGSSCSAMLPGRCRLGSHANQTSKSSGFFLLLLMVGKGHVFILCGGLYICLLRRIPQTAVANRVLNYRCARQPSRAGKIVASGSSIVSYLGETNCPECHQPIKKSTSWAFRHIVKPVDGRPDAASNLQMHHLNCHRHQHDEKEVV